MAELLGFIGLAVGGWIRDQASKRGWLFAVLLGVFVIVLIIVVYVVLVLLTWPW